MKFSDLAPIVLFVYNRPEHTRKTLEALAKNELAKESVLYIYADGPKLDATEEALEKIAAVRDLVKEEQWCSQVHIIESKLNKGLANSVIEGVTEVVNEFGKIIVLEDDLVTTPFFLSFINEALERYETDDEVMQVSGFQYPVQGFGSQHRSFFLPLTCTWGWGTWKRAWDIFDASSDGYEILKANKNLSHAFDLGGIFPYTNMLLDQMERRTIDSWGIRWYWSVFKQKGIVLFPDVTLVDNIGYGIDATHTQIENPYANDKHLDTNDYLIKTLPYVPAIDKKAFILFKRYLSSTSSNKKEIRKIFVSWVNKISSSIKKVVR